MTIIDRTDYAGHNDCYTLTEGDLMLIATSGVGPRVLSMTTAASANPLFVDAAPPGAVADAIGAMPNGFRLYGGHRLWHAPEHIPRTYQPDNQPVAVDEIDGGLRFTAPVEPATRIQKAIDISLHAGEPNIATLTHRLTNHGLWPVSLAPWAITIFRLGGVAIAPLPEGESHDANQLPTSSLTLWGYASLADPRLTLGERYVLLRGVAGAPTPQKLGLFSPAGWLAYAIDGLLFVKLAVCDPVATYPDLQSNLELFTNAHILELETLAPVRILEPGATVTHTEHWALFAGVGPVVNEADVAAQVVPRVEQLAATL